MQRAIKFYEELLGMKVHDPDTGLFILNGVRLCMYDYGKYNDVVVFANSCIPRFETLDIDYVQKKLEKLNAPIIVLPTKINGYKFLRFEDSEGNLVEVYSKQ